MTSGSGTERCEVCEEPLTEELSTLTDDGHPLGPNLVVCGRCDDYRADECWVSRCEEAPAEAQVVSNGRGSFGAQPLCEDHADENGWDTLWQYDDGLRPDGGQIEPRRRSADTKGWSVFGYPGNKAKLAKWIIPHFPDHRCYVEPFGGAAGVLANKPESKVEVYNDADGDLVQFFEVLRDRGAELVEWLADVPYSRENYEKWAPEWYDGWRPDDPVKCAGVFFYLRQTAFGGKYRYEGGFATSKTRNQAMTYRNQVDRLNRFADRFRGQVVIENLDWRDVLEKYDDGDTLFYLDPPYSDAKLRYRYGEDFDHAAFADALEGTEARWVVSYGEPPEPVREVSSTVVQRMTKYQMAAGTNGEPDASTETLLLNFDPNRVENFVDDQAELDQFGAGATDENRSVDTVSDRSGGER